METLGKRIRYFRMKAGLTQEGLASEVSVSKNTVLNWEKDKREPRASELEAVAVVLNVFISDLLPRPTPPSRAAGPYDGGEGLRHFRELPDGSLVPVDSAAGSLEEVLAENPDLELWFRTRKLSEEEKSQIAALLLQIKEQWEAEDQEKGEG